MDFKILEKVNIELNLGVNYLDSFKANFLDDKMMELALKDDDLKEELKSVVPPTGHRIAIINSFKKHLEENQVKCFYCKLKLKLNWNVVWRHLQQAHDFNTNCKNFTCPVCNASFIWLNSFRRHFNMHANLAKFPTETETNSANGLAQIYDSEAPQESSNQINSDDEEIPKLMTILEKQLVCFVVELQSTGKIPISVCTDICDMIKVLLENVVNLCKATFSTNKNAESNDVIISLNDCFKHVKSQYHLEKFLKDRGFYTEPDEIVLGSKHKIVTGIGITTTNLVFDTCQYVPISKTLRCVLKLPGVLDSVFTSISESNYSDSVTIHSNPLKGLHFQRQISEKYDVQIPVIYILLYFDEVEISNVLSSRAGLHNLGNIYISIMNIHCAYNSKLENIYHCMTFKSKDVSKYSLKTILEPLIYELQQLESTGLNISCASYNGTVQVRLGQVIGDNLGMHQLFGYCQSFSSNFYCRFCKMSKFLCQNSGRFNKQYLRNNNI